MPDKYGTDQIYIRETRTGSRRRFSDVDFRRRFQDILSVTLVG